MSYEGEEEEAEEVEGEGEEIPASVAELANAPVPNALRGIRACKRCGLLKTLDQFINEGCENCPFLDMVRLRKWLHRWIFVVCLRKTSPLSLIL